MSYIFYVNVHFILLVDICIHLIPPVIITVVKIYLLLNNVYILLLYPPRMFLMSVIFIFMRI